MDAMSEEMRRKKTLIEFFFLIYSDVNLIDFGHVEFVVVTKKE